MLALLQCSEAVESYVATSKPEARSALVESIVQAQLRWRGGKIQEKRRVAELSGASAQGERCPTLWGAKEELVGYLICLSLIVVNKAIWNPDVRSRFSNGSERGVVVQRTSRRLMKT